MMVAIFLIYLLLAYFQASNKYSRAPVVCAVTSFPTLVSTSSPGLPTLLRGRWAMAGVSELLSPPKAGQWGLSPTQVHDY